MSSVIEVVVDAVEGVVVVEEVVVVELFTQKLIKVIRDLAKQKWVRYLNLIRQIRTQNRRMVHQF